MFKVFFKQLALDIKFICKAPIVIRELSVKDLFTKLFQDSNSVALALYEPVNREHFILSSSYLNKNYLTKFRGEKSITLKAILKVKLNLKFIQDVQI